MPMPRPPDEDADERAALLEAQRAAREAREAVLVAARALLVEVARGQKVLGALSQAENSSLAAALVVLIDGRMGDPLRLLGLAP
jgi:hypothetical protein